MTKSAIVARMTASGDECSKGRMTTRSIAAPSTNAKTTVIRNAGQKETSWFVVSVQQM